MNKRKVSFIYRLLVIVSLLSGVMLNLVNTTSIQLLLSYYTMHSNLFCLVAFILFQIGDLGKYNYRENDLYYAGKGIVTIAILVTAIIYLIALVPNDLPMYTVSANRITSKWIGNLLVHVISPILVVGDYFLLDEKGKFKLYYPILWLFFPLQYVGFVYLYRAGGGHFYSIGGSRDFGYFFLDYRQIGAKGVIIWITTIAIGILMLGYILIGIDKKLAKRKQK